VGSGVGASVAGFDNEGEEVRPTHLAAAIPGP